ncbi:MAG: hypothetical protein FGM14_15540 [Flavobacteriales bacterium]|nr:hypothetical protein [Flavobacteriales bacterium]
MHILDKFNIVPVPLNQLPGNNLPPVPKKDSILPIILTVTGIVVFGAIAFYYYKKNREEEND